MRVRHFGNTANNAFYNVQLLSAYAGIESELPISMFAQRHAISMPAWEAVDFHVPDTEWVSEPDWSAFPEAVAVNSKYSDQVQAAGSLASRSDLDPIASSIASARRRLNGWLATKPRAQHLIDVRTRQWLSHRPVLAEPGAQVNILYGADPLISMQLPRQSARTVTFEHGTIRWAGSNGLHDKESRRAYRQQVTSSMHLWVTNLDPRTLEVAEDVAPGRWSALPHPFVPDARVPLAGSPMRQELLQRTASKALVLLPSSQNWNPGHDKGSIRALRAFIELRRLGRDIGLVAAEWGLQVGQSKALLESEGVDRNVVWVPPMARFDLQRMMADVDVVWDQFGLRVFGALALRTVEQGTPLVSSGVTELAEALMGGPVPWLTATEVEEIVGRTATVLDEMERSGRIVVIEETRTRYRGWLLKRHAPRVTAALQSEVYTQLVDGTFDPGSVPVDRWSQVVRENER